MIINGRQKHILDILHNKIKPIEEIYNESIHKKILTRHIIDQLFEKGLIAKATYRVEKENGRFIEKEGFAIMEHLKWT